MNFRNKLIVNRTFFFPRCTDSTGMPSSVAGRRGRGPPQHRGAVGGRRGPPLTSRLNLKCSHGPIAFVPVICRVGFWVSEKSGGIANSDRIKQRRCKCRYFCASRIHSVFVNDRVSRYLTLSLHRAPKIPPSSSYIVLFFRI